MIDELYETIGGRDTVTEAIRLFYSRVLQDESLRHFFVSADMTKLREGQSMFISMLLGGRIVYTGRDIGAAHEKVRALGLNDAHFQAFLIHFRAALAEVGVANETADQIVQLLETKRSSVLKSQQIATTAGD